MKRILVKIKCHFEKKVFQFKDAHHESYSFHLGTNTIIVLLSFFVFLGIALDSNVLNWGYLKGLNSDLSFFIGFFSIVMGVSFYKYWHLGDRSLYSFHLTKCIHKPKNVITLFRYRYFCFGIGSHIRIKTMELPPFIRQILSIAIFFNLVIITVDNRGFNIVKKLPEETEASKASFCPEQEELFEEAQPKEGCALIIRAYKLGYAKDLGPCEPKKVDLENLEVCLKRRLDEPYLHYMARLLVSSAQDFITFFTSDQFNKIKQRFEIQLQRLEELKDYQAYAMSAAPRASHHIWTNLPYPDSKFSQTFKELFNPGYCLEEFQNQTNTIDISRENEKKDSLLLEHVYGHLLFNPKVKMTVGFCKEYTIHWNADENICEKLSRRPLETLQQEQILSNVQLVLRRHDIAQVILELDEKFSKIEEPVSTLSHHNSNQQLTNQAAKKQTRQKIDTSKIAKNKQQLRTKNELVSFQCFMSQSEDKKQANQEYTISINNENFLAKAHYFSPKASLGESQIAMYKNFAKVLEERFHYTQYSSRSDLDLNTSEDPSGSKDDEEQFNNTDYLLARLEMLKNIDIFLGKSWILEREDLLEVYPFHVHLKNYVERFRTEYKESRGRL